MAYLLRPKRWMVKPSGPVQIDRDHPLAQGLAGLWLPDGIVPPVDLATRITSTAGGTPPTQGVVPSGVGASSTQVSTSFYSLRPSTGPIIAGQANWTVYGRFRASSFAVNGLPLYAETAGTDIIKLETPWSAGSDSGVGAVIRDDANNLLVNAGSGVAVADGKEHSGLVSFTFAGTTGTYAVYQDGRSVLSGSGTFGNAYTGALAPQMFADANDANCNGAAVVPIVAVWTRTLTADQAEWLHVEPYAMLSARRAVTHILLDGLGFVGSTLTRTHLAATALGGDLIGTAALATNERTLAATAPGGDLIGSAALRVRKNLAATAFGGDLIGTALPTRLVHIYSATDTSNIAVVDVSGEACLDVVPPAPTVPTGKTLNMRKFACYTYNAPAADGTTGAMVKQTRTPASSGTWGYRQVTIDGRDKTWVRGERTRIVGPMTWAIPGGPAVLTLRFPAIRPFEDLSTALALGRDIDGAKVSVFHRNADDTLDRSWTWQGNEHAKRPVMEGDDWYWEVDCVGFLQQPQQAVHQPPFAITSADEQDIGRRVARELNSWPQRDYARIKPVDVGIPTLLRGSFGDSRLAFTRDLLAVAWTTDGRQWRVADIPGPGRRSQIELPGTTADFHVSVGQDGVDFSNLVAEGDEAPNVIYGEWVDKDGNRSQNVKYPHEHEDTAPAYPLTDPAVFTAGDGHTGFQPFSDWLRDHGGGMIYSQDTYDARDVDDVEAAQTRMGVTVDGVVGRQTWGTAFNTGANVGDLNGAFYMPLAADTRTQPRLYTPDGQDIGPNPAYDPLYPVREVKVDFGSGVSRYEVVKAARALLHRNITGKNYAGTIKMTSDFEEGSRFSMCHGKNLAVRYLDGSGSAGVLFHISDVSHDDPESDESPVTLTVDTKFRDAPTLAAIIENRRDARRDPARVLRRQETAKLTQSTRTPFDKDNAAGKIYPHAIQSGFWRIVRFPAGTYGQFVDLISTTSPAREFVLGLFVKPVTANFLATYVGNPTDPANTRPFEPSRTVLRDAGLIQAWGSGAQPGGYSDGYAGAKTAGDVLTGKIEDDAGTSWASFDPPYLWLAEYCTGGNTTITVTFSNAPENV